MTKREAQRLSTLLTKGIDDLESNLERFIEGTGWTVLGYDTFREWWDENIHSVRLGPGIRNRVLIQMKKEQKELPKPQQLSQTELGQRVGVNKSQVSRSTRSSPVADASYDDLGEGFEEIGEPVSEEELTKPGGEFAPDYELDAAINASHLLMQASKKVREAVKLLQASPVPVVELMPEIRKSMKFLRKHYTQMEELCTKEKN